ncbi:methyl-accepting chemotaxis protein/ extracellular solute-binding protein family 5 [Clostridium botulinum A1 str. CFSAN002368]|nr:methyl-accepting chemotaxis protein/ extracellular solute-binding protein family 5 [Clostridium botulinum A1 str. CFSAN002368]
MTKDISNYVEMEMDSISKVTGEISNYSAIAEEVFLVQKIQSKYQKVLWKLLKKAMELL